MSESFWIFLNAVVSAADTVTYEFSGFTLDPGTRSLFGEEGQPIPVSPKVFDTLLYLISNPGKVLDKEDLIAAIWSDTIVEENNLNKNISVLRRLLGENPLDHRFIVTVPGKGYKFVAKVALIEKDAAETAFQNEDVSQQASDSPKVRWVFGAAVGGMILIGLLLAGAFYWPGGASSTGARTIAVLPFRPIVSEGRDEALEIGMADTLISRLGNNREIVVRPLSSVRHFGSLDQDPVAAGRALKVQTVLDGNIQRQGDRIRINVQLFNVADGATLWSQTFDENYTGIFAVQDAISTRLAGVLKFQLGRDDRKHLMKRETENVDAYQSYLKGRFHYDKYAPQEFRRALAFLHEAVKLDPEFAAAHAYLGSTYAVVAGTPDFPRRDTVAKAREFILRSIELDEQLSSAHEAYGNLLFKYDRDLVSAERELKRAIDLDPSNASAHETYGGFLTPLGRHDEALAEVLRAAEIDPLSSSIRSSIGNSLMYARRYDEAIVEYNKALELDAFSVHAHYGLASAHEMKGNFAESVGHRARIAELRNDPGGAALMRQSFASGSWRGFLREMNRNEKAPPMLPYVKATLLVALGEKDASLEILKKLVEEGSSQVFLLKVDPRLDPLRDDPRFGELLRRMNLE